jgi:hypothetical protein
MSNRYYNLYLLRTFTFTHNTEFNNPLILQKNKHKITRRDGGHRFPDHPGLFLAYEITSQLPLLLPFSIARSLSSSAFVIPTENNLCNVACGFL